MRLLILSDLHLEFGEPYTVPDSLEFDLAILAGDINTPGSRAVLWAAQEATFGGRPVLIVPGNHEFYGREVTTELKEMKAAATGSNVHILDRECVVIAGVRFVGCILWTDFQLPVRGPDGQQESDIELAVRNAAERLHDYQLIDVEALAKKRTHRQNDYRQLRRLMRPADTLAMHWIDRDWLRRQLLEPFAGPTVVVTHHAPSLGSVAERYAGDWLTPSFVSALPSSFFEVPQLWVHGHTHSPFDYLEGNCRVVSNPRGYRIKDGGFENHRFEPGFVIEVPGRAVAR